MATPTVLSGFGNGLTLNDVGSYSPAPGLTSSVAPGPDLYYGDSQALQPATNPQDQSYSDSHSPSYSSGPSYTQGVNDPNTLASYDQNINNTQSAIDRLPGQYQQGVAGINDNFHSALDQLLLNKNRANQTYNDNVLQTKQDYVGGKNTVRSRAGGALNGLLRLLGSRGAGGGSAATLTAPGAVARQATLQQADLGNTFGHNIKGLDTNWNNYLTDYQNQVNSADQQREQQGISLQSQIDSNRASLLQTLASLSGQKAAAQGGSSSAAAQPYLDQANATLNAITNFRATPINYQTLAYNAPSLDKYTVGSGATPTFNGAAQGNDYTSPYLAALLGKKQQGATI